MIGLVAGLVALGSRHGDTSITIETAVSAAALIGLVGDELLLTGPDSERALKKIRESVKGELLNDIKHNRAAPADLDTADEALAALLGGCMLEKEDLAACAIHSDGFPEHAASIITEKLATLDARFARSPSRSTPNNTFHQFAFKVLDLAFRSALEDRKYFERFQPYILSAISQGIGQISKGVTQANLKLDEQSPKIDAIYTHILKIVTPPPAPDIRPSMTLVDVVECLVRFSPSFIYLRQELDALRLKSAEKGDAAGQEMATLHKSVPDFAASLRRTIEATEKAHASGSGIFGVTTGFAEIDSLLGGFHPSDLLVLAGRPGMGKTALGTNIAFHAASTWIRDIDAGAQVPRGAPVLFFSLEMTAQQLSGRILSEQTEIEMWKIRNGKFTDSEWEKFVLTMHELSSLPLYIDDSAGSSIAQIAARARDMKREKNIGLIIIDYLQLVDPSRRRENSEEEITEVTKGLKALAKELNLPVLALSQLSRGVDARSDNRPALSDLPDSGTIEQDADVIMFIFREECYLKLREPDAGSAKHAKWLEKMERQYRRAELLVEKHRHGATGLINLHFDERFNRFVGLESLIE